MYAYDESYTIDFIEEFELNGKNELQPEKETANDNEDSYSILDEDGCCLGYEDAIAGRPFCNDLFPGEGLNGKGELCTKNVKAFKDGYKFGYQIGMTHKDDFMPIEVTYDLRQLNNH